MQVSIRTRVLLGVLGILVIAGSLIVLSYALQPPLVDSLHLPLDSSFFTPPLASP